MADGSVDVRSGDVVRVGAAFVADEWSDRVVIADPGDIDILRCEGGDGGPKTAFDRFRRRLGDWIAESGYAVTGAAEEAVGAFACFVGGG